MSTPTPEAIFEGILEKIYRAEQVDFLHLSLINLLDMVKDGEIDLMLEQPKKTFKQKAAFIDKVIEGIESRELRAALLEIFQLELEDPAHELAFFREKYLGALLRTLQQEAEHFIIVKLVVAVDFKEKDLREMVDLLEGKIERQVALELRVDPDLIGGAIIQFGTYISDYSLKTRLDLFRSHWHRAVVEEFAPHKQGAVTA